MTSTPHSLLERLQEDSTSGSWDRLVTIYTPWLDRVLSQARVPDTDRPDLIQESLVIVLRELNHFQHNGRPGAFRRWLRNVVSNRLRTYWRQRQRAEPLGDEQLLSQHADPRSPLDEFWEREHDQYLVQQLLGLVEGEFTASTWTAFRRQTVDGVRAADVARELGLSVNAVLLAKSRVLRRLRQEAAGLLDEL